MTVIFWVLSYANYKVERRTDTSLPFEYNGGVSSKFSYIIALTIPTFEPTGHWYVTLITTGLSSVKFSFYWIA
jgi:hypothetical protein